MWQRARAIWANFMQRMSGSTPEPLSIPASVTDESEIDFRSLSASEADAKGTDQELVCPVTRAILKRGSRLYRCNSCNTTFSPEGWEFLRKNDRGRCCSCRLRGTVFPA